MAAYSQTSQSLIDSAVLPPPEYIPGPGASRRHLDTLEEIIKSPRVLYVFGYVRAQMKMTWISHAVFRISESPDNSKFPSLKKFKRAWKLLDQLAKDRARAHILAASLEALAQILAAGLDIVPV